MTSCPLCDPGKYCDAPGLLSVRGECDPGFLCYSGATTSGPTDGTTGEVCPAGGYCVSGNYVLICMDLSELMTGVTKVMA